MLKVELTQIQTCVEPLTSTFISGFEARRSYFPAHQECCPFEQFAGNDNRKKIASCNYDINTKSYVLRESAETITLDKNLQKSEQYHLIRLLSQISPIANK